MMKFAFNELMTMHFQWSPHSLITMTPVIFLQSTNQNLIGM